MIMMTDREKRFNNIIPNDRLGSIWQGDQDRHDFKTAVSIARQVNEVGNFVRLYKEQRSIGNKVSSAIVGALFFMGLADATVEGAGDEDGFDPEDDPRITEYPQATEF
jgi:hypothetical protein